MKKIRAVLQIPDDRSWVRLASPDGTKEYFSGDQEQARRVSLCVPPMVGGNFYLYAEGDLRVEPGVNQIILDDIADLDSRLIIDFDVEIVQVSIVWSKA